MKIIEYESPHKSSRQGWKPDMICCHQTAGAAKSAINWFLDKESKVSAHYLVDKAGQIYSFVPIEKMAWANGTNTSDPEISYHYSKSKIKTVRERKTNANLYTVSVEFENDDTGILTDTQYEAGLWLMKKIIADLKEIYGVEFLPDREHIIGHSDLNPIRKAGCPGKDFPFEKFINDLNTNNEKEKDNVLYCVHTKLYKNLNDAENIVKKMQETEIEAYIKTLYEQN